MSGQRYYLILFEGFFLGLVGTGAVAILASTIVGGEAERFVFSVMPWIMVVGSVGNWLVRRNRVRLEADANG